MPMGHLVRIFPKIKFAKNLIFNQMTMIKNTANGIQTVNDFNRIQNDRSVSPKAICS